ncbi:MAG: MBL fold metallo-hydrolase [Spirochaetales bacterium]|nr:MBL fold metallo-hydrolase [Spirochaetales bacterium]
MPPLTLTQLSNSTFYISSPSNVGVIIYSSKAILIDSGNNREAGRQILKLLKERDLELSLIVNTHSHADHIGGNEFLQKRTNCRVAATSVESNFIEHPVLEPTVLNGGFPHIRLQNKFLMARPSRVTDILLNSGKISETSLTAVPLPGHFLDMIGVETVDEVLFTADSVIAEEVLEKYHLNFLYDIKSHFKTLAIHKQRENSLFVPSHGNPVGLDLFRGLVEYNEFKLNENIRIVLDQMKKKQTSEEILAQVCRYYNLELNANQYVLIFSTVRSILAYLLDEKKVEVLYTEGQMLWRRL